MVGYWSCVKLELADDLADMTSSFVAGCASCRKYLYIHTDRTPFVHHGLGSG